MDYLKKINTIYRLRFLPTWFRHNTDWLPGLSNMAADKAPSGIPEQCKVRYASCKTHPGPLAPVPEAVQPSFLIPQNPAADRLLWSTPLIGQCLYLLFLCSEILPAFIFA